MTDFSELSMWMTVFSDLSMWMTDLSDLSLWITDVSVFYMDDGIFRHPHAVLLRHAWLL
jgi:hypothetical protein